MNISMYLCMYEGGMITLLKQGILTIVLCTCSEEDERALKEADTVLSDQCS